MQNAPPEEVLDLHSDREGEEEEEQQDQDDLKDGVWDNFREQHHEAVEILPLTLHRNYGLLRELDQQSDGYLKALLPTARSYISHRRSLKHAPSTSTSSEPTTSSQPPATPIGPPPTLHLSKRMFRTPRPPFDMPRPPLARVDTPMTPITPIALPPERTKEPQSSREMLSHIAWLSEDLLRNSQEKVNLAQSCCELVDRQVRLVEQAIRDQELVIAHEVRPGTHPTPIVLADITAPQKYTRPTRVSFSPIRSFHDYVDPPSDLELEEDAVVDVLGQEEQQPPESSEKGSKKGKKDSKGGEKGQKSMIIRIPAQRLSEPRTSSEPGEAIWCYCKMPESQDQQDRPMVGCDYDECEWGWFHIDCLKLKEVPSGDVWYCPSHESMQATSTKPTKKRARRRRKG